MGVDMLEARDELMSIGVSKHDDIVDTMAYAEQLIQPYFGNTIDNNGFNGTVELVAGFGDSYGYGR